MAEESLVTNEDNAQEDVLSSSGSALTDRLDESIEGADGTILTAATGEEGSGEQGEAQQEAVIPETYDIKTVDGYELMPDTMEAISPILKKYKITQDGAQELANAHMEIMKKQNEANAAFQKNMIADWVKQIKSDSEFGGVNFDKNMALARKGLKAVMPGDKEGDAALKELLDASGMGNHPAMIKAFARVGKLLKEDSVLDKGKSSGASSVFNPETDMFAKSLGLGE